MRKIKELNILKKNYHIVQFCVKVHILIRCINWLFRKYGTKTNPNIFTKALTKSLHTCKNIKTLVERFDKK